MVSSPLIEFFFTEITEIGLLLSSICNASRDDSKTKTKKKKRAFGAPSERHRRGACIYTSQHVECTCVHIFSFRTCVTHIHSCDTWHNNQSYKSRAASRFMRRVESLFSNAERTSSCVLQVFCGNTCVSKRRRTKRISGSAKTRLRQYDEWNARRMYAICYRFGAK